MSKTALDKYGNNQAAASRAEWRPGVGYELQIYANFARSFIDDLVRVEFAGVGRVTSRTAGYFISHLGHSKPMVFQPLLRGWFA